MAITTIAAVAAGLLITAIMAASIVFYIAVTRPKVWNAEMEINTLRDNWGYDMEPFLSSVEHIPFECKTIRGYTLKGEIVPAGKESAFPDSRQRAVILCHGYTAHRTKMLAFGEIYHRLGFSLVLYDQRFHGDSDKVFCSMGYYEAMDVEDIALYARSLFPEDTVWGLQGESMGAAAALMAAPQMPWLGFVCEDCGFASLKQELADSWKYKTGLPAHPVAELCCLWFRLFNGIKPEKVRPVEATAKIHVPMLLVHGGQDRYVPAENLQLLYEAKSGTDKRKLLFDDVPHAKSIAVHHKEYAAELQKFLAEYKLI